MWPKGLIVKAFNNVITSFSSGKKLTGSKSTYSGDYTLTVYCQILGAAKFFSREKKDYIHTYIHNWPLQPFSLDY